MGLQIAQDGYPWMAWGGGILGVAAAAAVPFAGGVALFLAVLAVVWVGFMVFFFRDPDRTSAAGPEALVSGADGLIRAVEWMPETEFLKTDAVRISVFLSPLDVHINRSPLAGSVKSLQYTPGRHLLTYSNASSEENESSSIFVQGEKTRCLVRQIVGPIVRRVVYWLHEGQVLGRGDRIGLMKFGSRLDMYFPAAEVEVLVKKGDRVRAGETVVARVKKG